MEACVGGYKLDDTFINENTKDTVAIVAVLGDVMSHAAAGLALDISDSTRG